MHIVVKLEFKWSRYTIFVAPDGRARFFTSKEPFVSADDCFSIVIFAGLLGFISFVLITVLIFSSCNGLKKMQKRQTKAPKIKYEVFS